jgi:hypothetical protein
MSSQGMSPEGARLAPDRLWGFCSAFSVAPQRSDLRRQGAATRLLAAVGICLSLVIAACAKGGADDNLPVITPNDTMISSESSAISSYVDHAISGPDFSTVEYLEATGVVGDGASDNTLAFIALLGTGNRKIHIRSGDYVTGSLSIPSGTVLLLDPGVTIRDSGKLGPEDRLINIVGENNVYIRGPGARIIANRANYTTGEQRHGVFVYGSSNVIVEGLESTGHGGDGFYVGGPPNTPSENIVLAGCLASDNRRQGLSITSARRVYVVDCEFDQTNGTAPQFGVDLEPNLPTDFLNEIRLLRPHTLANVGGGIQILLDKLGPTSPMVDVQIIEHSSEAEAPKFLAEGPSDVHAQIQYSSASGIPL